MSERVESGESFTTFVTVAEPALRRALVASYGSEIGREACLDALAWAWENWDRARLMANPAGYLFRVGQTSARKQLSLAHQTNRSGVPADAWSPEPAPELQTAVGMLSEQQRVAVVLVHGYGYRQTEVAEMLGVTVSTLREHLRRGVERLRQALEEAE